MQESKSAWRMSLLAAYLRWKYRQRFAHVRVGGFPGWQNWLASEAPYPLVLYGNHQTWWDGLLDFTLTRHFGMDSRLMMEAANLRKFAYFQQCGVFGVELDSARGRAAGLLHAVRLLQEKSSRRCLIIYPHGRLTKDWENAPFQSGLETILARAPQATALPVWRMIHFGDQEKPFVEIEIGEPISAEKSPSSDILCEKLAETRNRLIARLNDDNIEEIVYISKSLKT